MTDSIPRRQLTLIGALALAVGIAACQTDELAGPVVQVGEPLLDFALGPSPRAVFPSASFTFNSTRTRDTLTITLANLPPLPPGVSYQVLLVDSATVDSTGTNNLVPVTGRLITTSRSRRPVTRDSAVLSSRVDTAASVSAIASADTNQTFVLRVIDTPQAPLINFSHVLVVVGPTPVAAAATLDRTTRRGFLFGRYRDARGTPSRADDVFSASGNLTFGSFALDANRRVPFSVSGQSNAAFRGTEIRVNLQNLIRPPEGFQYAAWLVDDRTGRQVRLGTLQTPVPSNQSLANADTDPSSPSAFLTEVGIAAAQLRANVDTLGADQGIVFDDFTQFFLLLEPKGGSGQPPSASSAIVLQGAVPPSVSSRHPESGQISGKVVSASNLPVVGTTVYVTGAGLRLPVLVTNANAAGDFLFRIVSVGSYTLFAVPPGASVATDSLSVVVGPAEVKSGLTLRIP
ncbi:MAG: carboxypeptidase regulatory-like domain-containing protein [Gemmatimonadaceae bacterium]|nr:carboxypeptidase regulatory-like domain-containing protein [Gemmatimonadaceae bacterium]